MKLSIIFMILFFMYGLFFMVPANIKILKKFQRTLSGKEIRIMAKNGDLDAKAVTKTHMIMLTLISVGLLFFILETCLVFLIDLNKNI